jgi:hypothetical protein
MPQKLVLDACILMSGVLRPLFLHLGQLGWFDPIWSDQIGREWRRNAARLWSVDMALLEQAWEDMQLTFPQANVDTWHSSHTLPTLQYSDAKDWHVILTGIQAKLTFPDTDALILTWNIKDFRRSELRQHGLGLADPDRWLSRAFDEQPQALVTVIEQTLADLVSEGRRQPEPSAELLKRERLFRLAKLYPQKCHA